MTLVVCIKVNFYIIYLFSFYYEPPIFLFFNCSIAIYVSVKMASAMHGMGRGNRPRCFQSCRAERSGTCRGAPTLSGRKWIFRALHFCEDCLLAALTVSAVPAVIDEPGGTFCTPPHPPTPLFLPHPHGSRGREGGRIAAPSFLMTLHA